jgi:class 3 adenylate cyclase/HEAT repeat protein
MTPKPADSTAAPVLGRQGKITVLSLLKNFYDEEVFGRLVKEFYEADVEASEAAIRASGSLGNEIAIPHLYQIIERGRKSQRIEAVRALAAVRAPSATGMLIKYFNHFPEEELRAEILRAINTISPTSPQAQELNQAVYLDPRQSEAVKRIAVEALADGEKYALLHESLPRAAPAIQQAAFMRLLQAAGQEVPDFTREMLSPSAMGCYLCLYAVAARPEKSGATEKTSGTVKYSQNVITEAFQKRQKQTLLSFLLSLSQFQGRLRYPTRILRILLQMPYVDTETEILAGDFLKKIVVDVKKSSPQLVSEFSDIVSGRLVTIFANIRKSYISLQGVKNKDALLATVLATLLERYANPSLLAGVHSFFKDEGDAGRAPPLAQLRALMAGAPKEDQNRLDACIPLFTLSEKKDKLQVLPYVARVDLERPMDMRRLNRLIRVAGSLEIRTAAKKIQEVLDFSREERIPYLEETCIVTLCQLLTRSIIEQSREYFKEPGRNIRSLNGYIRGARFMPPQIMIVPLVHILQAPGLNPQSRALAVDSLAAMDLSSLRRVLPALIKALDGTEVDDALRLEIGAVLAKHGDGSISPQILDLTQHRLAAVRRAAVRVLKALAARGQGVPPEIVTNRLYLLLEDAERSVRTDALLALLAMRDDYAAQIVSDYVKAGDAETVAQVLQGVDRPLTRETFRLAMEMLRMDSQPVQEGLRAVLPELCQGDLAEELRQGLLDALSGTGGRAAAAEALPVAGVEAGSALGQAKLEFKFKRENTQVLTVLFIDMADSTQKSNELSQSAYLRLIKTFEELMEASITANRGQVVKKMGDGILATFKHALNATVAALAAQQKVQQHNARHLEQDKFHVRAGLNTGSVTLKDNDVFGPQVSVASRLQNYGARGDVLLTQSTFDRIREFVRCTKLGGINVKGFAEPITAYKAEEITVDLARAQEGAAAGQKGGPADSTMERLKETIFVPSFQLPPGKSEVAALLRTTFTELAKAIEDVATDAHEEYVFKKYLQDKWEQILARL